ncbi:MAG: PRC-barrel domain-containing protein [Chloroflexota bacterium]|nr:MAG: hypothetical protein DLM70_19150 [Chloroflexota bacterium]
MSSTVSVGELSPGLSVVGSDGTKIGVINEVVENPNVSPQSPASMFMQIDHGGFLGIGDSHLCVPVAAIDAVHAGREVVLSCTADDARHKYQNRPS